MKESDPHRYDDIIHLPHYVSEKQPQLSLQTRAAQFSPFAALTGYGEQVEEAARRTDRRILLDEDEKAELDRRLRLVQQHLEERPEVTITYFVPDERKAGGVYRVTQGAVKRINLTEKTVVFYAENGISDGEAISIDRIRDVSGTDFSPYGFVE